jgi:alkylated DNA nucleotide flippase Atl1
MLSFSDSMGDFKPVRDFKSGAVGNMGQVLRLAGLKAQLVSEHLKTMLQDCLAWQSFQAP